MRERERENVQPWSMDAERTQREREGGGREINFQSSQLMRMKYFEFAFNVI
jgi:hypothetical protein